MSSCGTTVRLTAAATIRPLLASTAMRDSCSRISLVSSSMNFWSRGPVPPKADTRGSSWKNDSRRRVWMAGRCWGPVRWRRMPGMPEDWLERWFYTAFCLGVLLHYLKSTPMWCEILILDKYIMTSFLLFPGLSNLIEKHDEQNVLQLEATVSQHINERMCSKITELG